MSFDPQDMALYGKTYAKYKGHVKLELYDMEAYEDVGVNDQECTIDEEDTARKLM
jgi:hypothetical protein